MSRTGDRYIVDLFRDIAQNNKSGLLRLTSGRVIKALFFEGGVPVFAISNQTTEQLDYQLLERVLVTEKQLAEAKTAAGQPHKLGQILVQTRLLTKEQIDQVTADLAKNVILSVFSWVKAEAAFDERGRAVHDVKVQWSPAECILQGVRAAAIQDRVADQLVPADATVTRPVSASKLASSGTLTSAESYILSRVEGPTLASDLGDLTGLGESETRKALCALIAIGLLSVVGAEQDQLEEPGPGAAPSAADVEDDIDRRLDYFEHSDFYEILGMTRLAGGSEIKAAYYKLAKKYHPDIFRQSDNSELRGKAEKLFARITQAYETLGDTAQKMLYDEQLRKSGRVPSAAPSKPVGREQGTKPDSEKPRVTTGSLNAREDKGRSAAAPNPPKTDRKTAPLSAPPPPPASNHNHGASSSASQTSEEASKQHATSAKHNGGAPAEPSPTVHAEPPAQLPHPPHPPGQSPSQAAEFYYQQARTRIDQKDYYGAIQLLRECVRLDANKPHFHFHLGMNLLKNPRTRREGEFHLTKAAQLDPFNAQIRVKVGMMYKEAGLAMKAEHFFREALAMDPGNRVALRELQGAPSKKKDDSSIWKADLGSIAKKILKK
jgi:curved DNA-binding protein CbpA